MSQQPRTYLTHDDHVVPMHFPRLLVEVAAEQCADRAGLLHDTGMTAAMLDSPDARISFRQYARLCRNAIRLTDNPGLGIDLGTRVRPPNLGMLGLAAMSCPDAKTAIDIGLRFYRLLAPFWDLSLESAQGVSRIVVREASPLLTLRVFATEVLLGSWMSVGRYVVGRDLPLLGIELGYPKPPHAKRYKEITEAPVWFGRSVTTVQFDSALLDQKLLSQDPATMRAAERYCEVGLSAAGGSEGLAAKVRRALESSPGNYPTLPKLAKSLQTSERTLRRDLVDMGTSYQSMLDIVRCKHATELLVGTDMSINDIAERLGFSEGRALRRAFKRWTGLTADKYRKQKPAQ